MRTSARISAYKHQVLKFLALALILTVSVFALGGQHKDKSVHHAAMHAENWVRHHSNPPTHHHRYPKRHHKDKSVHHAAMHAEHWIKHHT